jgi:hypothetical protein
LPILNAGLRAWLRDILEHLARGQTTPVPVDEMNRRHAAVPAGRQTAWRRLEEVLAEPRLRSGDPEPGRAAR